MFSRPRQHTVPQNAPHVVIIGGGFAGLAAAKVLSDEPVRVTLIDRNNFHTFVPLLYQVATAGLEPADVAYPLRTILARNNNIQFRHAHVQSIDRSNQLVCFEAAEPLAYDYLIVASGANANYFSIPGAHENALALYTLSDARRLRNRVLSEMELAEGTDEKPGSITLLIVGGGPTGVETAGAISELLETSIRRDRLRLDPFQSKVILVDQTKRLLASFPTTASKYAKEALNHKNVEVRLEVTVVEVGPHHIETTTGEIIEAAVVIWTAGVSVETGVTTTLQSPKLRNGQVEVETNLSLNGDHRVFVAGDAGAIRQMSNDSLCAQVAPVAIKSGRHCAHEILRLERGEDPMVFHFRDKGMMATIGRRVAIAKLPRGPVFRGVVGWLAWLALHLYYLIGFRNRIRVVVNWIWRYFDWPSGPRLIVGDVDQ